MAEPRERNASSSTGLSPGTPASLRFWRNDYDELLSHVLFRDVTRYAADLARRSPQDPDADTELLRLLDDLNSAIVSEGASDDPVNNMVWVSFVENASTDADEPLRTRLRSFLNLARALSHYE